MGVSPPYLHDDTEQGVSIRVDFSADAAVSLLTVHGSWDDKLRRNTSVTLRRCFTELQGFVGCIVNDYQSAGADKNTMVFYDGPEYDAFWKVAEELDCPVYLHPREATPLVFDQMWKDRPWLAYAALGHAHRVSMHVLGIVTAGVLDRFPKLKIVIGHMGEHM